MVIYPDSQLNLNAVNEGHTCFGLIWVTDRFNNLFFIALLVTDNKLQMYIHVTKKL